jgi:hypothetical protein
VFVKGTIGDSKKLAEVIIWQLENYLLKQQ